MPRRPANDVELHYEVQGSGEPLVLVHGSWADHNSWAATADILAARFRVVTYDRRGHSRSERPAHGWTRRESEDDLAAVIETIAGAPAHVVGNSFGGLVTLGLAARRPELFRGLAVHEPPATSVAAGGEPGRLVDDALATIDVVVAEIEDGAAERATRRFMEEVALGPGAWSLLTEQQHATFVGNAPAFAVETAQPDWASVDVTRLNALDHPRLFTKGDAAPQWLQHIVDRLAELIPGANKETIAGAGHAPHLTHPQEYSDLLTAFFARSAALAA